MYSAFLVEEEGTASTFRGAEGGSSPGHGLPMTSIPAAGRIAFTPRKRAARSIGVVRPRSAGRSTQLGVEHIGAYSPQARGRSERTFGTLQDRLVKELALAGIADIEAANAFIREVYFARPRRPLRR